MQMLVRNRVKDFGIWYNVLMEDQTRGERYGVRLVKVWQAHNDPNNAFFLLDIDSIEQTEALMASPESAHAGERSGVIDGEFYYLDPIAD